MRRGTTPTIPFTIDGSTENIAQMELYIANSQGLILEKKLSEMTVSGNEVSVKLTQADTLKLQDNSFVKLQIRILYKDGTVVASDVEESFVEEILKDGEIVED